MKSFHENYFNAQQNAMYTYLLQIDENVAKEYQKISNAKETKIPILPNEVQYFEDNNIIQQYLEKRYNDYKKEMLTPNKIANIKRALNASKNNKIDLKFINFDAIAHENNLKDNFIFDKNIIDKFSTNGMLNVQMYISFIESRLSFEQSTLKFLKYNSSITQSKLSLEPEKLKDFIISRSKHIKALRPLFVKLIDFQDYYFEIVLAIFIFFVAQKNLRFNIKELFSCHLFHQFIEMDTLPEKNPFTLKHTIKIYNAFATKDSRMAGMLCKDDIKILGKKKFTYAFLERLFEVLGIYDEGIDIILFTRIILASKNMSEVPGAQFFFKVFDLDDEGVINQFDILYFYKSMIAECNIKDEDRSLFKSFLSKLLDIIGCHSPEITLDQLIKSNSQEIFFLLLCDINTFKEWECDEEES